MRIGINVPDDLLKRLEPMKTVTNVSQICRDAIKAQVEAYERAMARANQDGMEAIAERLGAMMVPQEVDWELLGIEDAKMWVQLAKPEDFERQFDRLERFVDQRQSPWTRLIQRVEGSIWYFDIRADEHQEWLRWIDQSDDETSSLYLAAKREYEQAYLNYILAVWNMAKKMAKEKQSSESVAREKARREARTQIKVPDHLVESPE